MNVSVNLTKKCNSDRWWNPSTDRCENGKCLASIMEVSAITCDKIIEETKIVSTNFNEKSKL